MMGNRKIDNEPLIAELEEIHAMVENGYRMCFF